MNLRLSGNAHLPFDASTLLSIDILHQPSSTGFFEIHFDILKYAFI